MGSTTPEGQTNRRELVAFIRLAPRLVGVETYMREIEWVRRERAQSEIRVKQPDGKFRIKAGLDYSDQEAVLHTAINNCTLSAKRYGCLPGSFFPEAEIVLNASVLETPYIVGTDGELEAIPDDWVVEEPEVLAAWLKACQTGKKPKLAGRKLVEQQVAAGIVWRSQASDDTNHGMLKNFGGVVAETPEDAPSPMRR